MKKVATFAKVSEKEYKERWERFDWKDIDNYSSVSIPTRVAENATGYQIASTIGISIRSGQTAHIPTGIRCKLDEGYALKIYPCHTRFGSYLQGTVTIVDNAYNESKEGHIIISLTNVYEQSLTIEEGEQIAIGILEECFLATNG